ncbi:MAG: hypothetical protein JO132_07775 [Streptosporangiaceae bacterium]|nr:hypothetical protein [Streptosporangiaceae bacterium]
MPRAARDVAVTHMSETGRQADTGLGHFPLFDYGVNQAWLTAVMIAAILLASLKLLALGRRPGQSRAQDAALGSGFCAQQSSRRKAGARSRPSWSPGTSTWRSEKRSEPAA